VKGINNAGPAPERRWPARVIIPLNHCHLRLMPNSDTFDGARSALWMKTAPDAPQTRQLCEVEAADVTIVGAGFTGLNAAIELASRGISVCVLEAAWLGFGASGRSGGQVNLGLNSSPTQLIDQFGEDAGRRLLTAVIRTPETVFERVRDFGLRCDPVQKGWIQAAATRSVFDWQQNLSREYARYGCQLQVMDRLQTADATGSERYHGGLFSATAGSLQPLSYTRELARYAISQGVRIYTDSAVTRLEKKSQWQVYTQLGSVRCDKVMICTNGYSGREPVSGLAKKVVPVRSILAATEPLSEDLRQKILPGQVTFVDKRRLILYMRYDRDGRLCCGDHGPLKDEFVRSDYHAMKQRVVSVFPELKGIRWDYHWGGRIAMTKDSLPFLTELEPGLTAAMGYNGRGVGMGTVLGIEAARFVAGLDKVYLAFPVSSPKSFALHRWHKLGVSFAINWYSLRDRLESISV